MGTNYAEMVLVYLQTIENKKKYGNTYNDELLLEYLEERLREKDIKRLQLVKKDNK